MLVPVTKDDVEPAPTHHQHAVQFYESEESLYKTVSTFLGQGLIDGQPAILIATPSHQSAILAHLTDRAIDVEKAQGKGDLVVLDAQETLDLFMTGDVPDAATFNVAVGGIVDRALSGRAKRTMVRAYGEMVDVLWRAGRSDAAIRLEMLWNKLAMDYGFALLCGYAMGNFYKETARFEEVCRQHAYIVPPDFDSLPIPSPTR
jgi:hypothetical protein